MINLSWKGAVALLSIATVGIAGITYAASQKANTPSREALAQPQTEMVASPWDQNIQPYTGDAELVVYRSPTCGCCGQWIEHMKRHGFTVKEDVKTNEMEAIKAQHGVPQDLGSCHTTVVGGYVVEGHIPADDVKNLLQNKPDIAGIAVPGMPMGSPGMEAGEMRQDFAVLAFNEAGEVEVFEEHIH